MLKQRWARKGLVLALAGPWLFGAETGALAQTEIRVALGVSPAHALVTHGWAGYAAAATAEAAGALKFRMLIGSQHIAPQNTLAGLQDGIIDAAFLPTLLWPGEFPHQRLIGELALLGTDAVAMTSAISEFVLRHCVDCQREMAAQRVVFTGALSSGAFLMFTRERLVQPQALRAKKIRTPGKPWNRWTASFNALPVGAEGSLLRDALQTGTLDAAIASIPEAQEHGLWAASGHATLHALGTPYAGMPAAFGLDFWRRLTAADRKILLANASHAALGTALRLHELEREALRQATGQGFTLNQPDPRLVQAHDAFVQADLALIEREATAYGIRNAKAKIELVARLAKKWDALANQADHDASRLSEQLRREIYAKLEPVKYGL